MKQINLKLLPDGWTVSSTIAAGFLIAVGWGLAGCVGSVVAPAAGGFAKEQVAKLAADAGN